MKRWTVMAVLGLALAAGNAAHANDSEAAIGIGGLTFKQSKAISLDSEDLYLSPDKVRVAYKFTNRSSRDIVTTVAFPMPEMRVGQVEWSEGEGRDWKDFHFTTTVDGVGVPLRRVDEARVGGRLVNARLAALGVPIFLVSMNDDPFAKLPAAKKRAMLASGLLKPDGTDLVPTWTVRTSFVREQRFPAGKTINVVHSYKPLIGGSVGGGLNPDVRKDAAIARRYERDYCTDASFYSGVDRMIAGGRRHPDGMGYTEAWLDYALTPGANWAGPIRDYRLVVDKGQADRLVSFCGNGVKKISPTQFEIWKTNFEPRRDIHILIINPVKPGA